MCSTITFYACDHTHMEKTSCKYKRTGFFCFFPASKSKCLVVTRARSDRNCRICRESEDRQRREQRAKQRRINRDSYVDPELNRELAALPSFQMPQAPPAAVVRQPTTRPQPPRTYRPYQAPASNPARRPSLDSRRPSPTRGRPRVTTNIPPSVTMNVRDRSVSPVEPGYMNPRSVSPDDYGRAHWHYK